MAENREEDSAESLFCDESSQNCVKMPSNANLEDDESVYGQMVLLGYNGIAESKGVSLTRRSKITWLPKTRTITRLFFTSGRTQTHVEEYVIEPSKDMFQIGRSSEEQIDFTVVDTYLAVAPSASAHHHHHKKSEKSDRISSTISRYACRILIDRENGNKAFLYAAGFDLAKNIFLGDKSTKWTKKNGEMDGLTTNGVLILHPNRNTEDLNSEDTENQELYVWREISVGGDIYTLRDTRSSSSRGQLVPEETNMLQDGTLIDLCGATILWRTADGLARSPSALELEMALDRLNAGRPQCPVNLNTLIIPKKKSSKATNSRQAYVYLRCGHVQGRHEWGVVMNGNGQISGGKCPICLVESERIIQLTMGMETTFHIDSGSLDYAFNPCGHVASKNTVRYWSRIPLPQGTNSFHPVCPFCTTMLATEKPFLRLIFQDHCFDS
ncbi:unnamed protein product [Caenorhabditis auriculariae]|uniref:Protein pellino n=1 Tax=Caenorhabditis auriculariae TaxID=2777116 RepID=A0A8S1GUM1_9PELO|nr:unnamed protein product [Caenorhabditis auriculariae]